MLLRIFVSVDLIRVVLSTVEYRRHLKVTALHIYSFEICHKSKRYIYTRFAIFIDSSLCILYNLDGRACKLSFRSEQAFISQGCSQVFDVAIKTTAIHAERLNAPGLFLLITQNRSTSIGVCAYK